MLELWLPVAIRETASQGDRQKPTYVSGGVAGNLFVQAWGDVGRVGDSRTPKNVHDTVILFVYLYNVGKTMPCLPAMTGNGKHTTSYHL